MVKGVRFQVLINGVPLCVAGMPAPGVLQVIVEADDWTQEYSAVGTPIPRTTQECKVSVGGMTQTDDMLEWRLLDLAPGDEVTVRVLPAGEADPPRLMRHDQEEWEPWDEQQ